LWKQLKSPHIPGKANTITGKQRKRKKKVWNQTRLPVLPATGNAVVKKTFSTTFGTCGLKGKKKKNKSESQLQTNFCCSNSKYLHAKEADTPERTHRKTFNQ